MKTVQQEVDERTRLISHSKFELMLFRLGTSSSGDSPLYGINVFKIRELLDLTTVTITPIFGSQPHVMGVVNVRGQIIQVIDLASAIGAVASDLRILMVTEYAGSTQAFAVEGVEEIVRLEWNKVSPAEGVAAGGGTVTSIAHLDNDIGGTGIAQVLDVEQILRSATGQGKVEVDAQEIGGQLRLPDGTIILAADDSGLARMMIEDCLAGLGLPYTMTKTGKEAWEHLQSLGSSAAAEGKTVHDKVALVLTDLEMPEMDGFTLTKNIKGDARFQSIPVLIHSSLTGAANENHVRSVGANGYVAKFSPAELAASLRKVLSLPA